MNGHFFRCVWVIPLVGIFLPSQLLAVEIKLFSVKEVAAKWLEESNGVDASADLDAVILELWTSDKKMAAVARFENAILKGQPLDPDKNALHIALNFLTASTEKCSVVVPQKKDKPGPWVFVGTNGTVHSIGGHTTGLDFSTTPRLKSLGKVQCDLKFFADADQFEETKDKLSTARLTLRAVLTVKRSGSSTDYRRELGEYRITAGENTTLSALPKWAPK